MVNSDVICSVTFYHKILLSCVPWINMALRSESWAFTFTFTLTSLSFSVWQHFVGWIKCILSAFDNLYFLQPPSLWQLAPFPGIRAWTSHHPINLSNLLSPQCFAQWEKRQNPPKLLRPAKHFIKHRLHTYIYMVLEFKPSQIPPVLIGHSTVQLRKLDHGCWAAPGGWFPLHFPQVKVLEGISLNKYAILHI